MSYFISVLDRNWPLRDHFESGDVNRGQRKVVEEFQNTLEGRGGEGESVQGLGAKHKVWEVCSVEYSMIIK